MLRNFDVLHGYYYLHTDKKMSDYLISVITPTYNRAKEIHRVYNSLINQDYKNFEWIVVDDGSTDNTSEIIYKYQKDSDFLIKYIFQENNHKKSAVNTGLRNSSGQFNVIADSDDEFPFDALSIFIKTWQSIPDSSKDEYCGVYGLCIYKNGLLVGDKFPGEYYYDSNTVEIRRKMKISGEKWGMVKTDIMLEYLFPENITGHVPEDVMWSPIAKRYKSRFVNKVVRIYHQDSDNQLSKIQNPRPHAVGALLSKRISLEDESPYFKYDPRHYFLEAARWGRFYLHSTDRVFIKDYIPVNFIGRTLILLAFPVGLVMYFNDLRKKTRR